MRHLTVIVAMLCALAVSAPQAFADPPLAGESEVLRSADGVGLPDRLGGDFDIPQLPPSNCYTTNCTGTDIRNRRDCYLCCAADCAGGGTREVDCQNDCDAAWIRTIGDAIPLNFLLDLTQTRYDPDAQRAILIDADLWDWMIGDDGFAAWYVIDVADWLVQNAASDLVKRLAIVHMAWLAGEHRIDDIGASIVVRGLRAELYHENENVRLGALMALRESGLALTDPQLALEMIRLAADDPSPKVRATGVAVISRLRR